MKTVITNSAQCPCLPLSLTRRFSSQFPLPTRWGEGQGEGLLANPGSFNSFPAIRPNPTISDQIRLTFLPCCPDRVGLNNGNERQLTVKIFIMRLTRTVKKSEITNPQKPLKFNFI